MTKIARLKIAFIRHMAQAPAEMTQQWFDQHQAFAREIDLLCGPGVTVRFDDIDDLDA